jgi:hypothetical protein
MTHDTGYGSLASCMNVTVTVIVSCRTESKSTAACASLRSEGPTSSLLPYHTQVSESELPAYLLL